METAKLVVGIIHIILSVIIIALILLQSGKQAGLARFTKICAILFLITSLFLAYGDAVVNKTSTTENATNVEIPVETETEVPGEGEVPADAEAPAETDNTEDAPADTGAEN